MEGGKILTLKHGDRKQQVKGVTLNRRTVDRPELAPEES